MVNFIDEKRPCRMIKNTITLLLCMGTFQCLSAMENFDKQKENHTKKTQNLKNVDTTSNVNKTGMVYDEKQLIQTKERVYKMLKLPLKKEKNEEIIYHN